MKLDSFYSHPMTNTQTYLEDPTQGFRRHCRSRKPSCAALALALLIAVVGAQLELPDEKSAEGEGFRR